MVSKIVLTAVALLGGVCTTIDRAHASSVDPSAAVQCKALEDLSRSRRANTGDCSEPCRS